MVTVVVSVVSVSVVVMGCSVALLVCAVCVVSVTAVDDANHLTLGNLANRLARISLRLVVMGVVSKATVARGVIRIAALVVGVILLRSVVESVNFVATDQGQILVASAVVVGGISMATDEVGHISVGTVVVSVVSMMSVVSIATFCVGVILARSVVESVNFVATDQGQILVASAVVVGRISMATD